MQIYKMVRKYLKIRKLPFLRRKMLYSMIILAAASYTVYNNWNIFNMGLFNEKTRLGSRDFGKWGNTHVPFVLRSILYGTYSMYYGVNTNDMIYPLNHYDTINKFFTREVQPRSISDVPGAVVCPADSLILSIDKVNKDSVLAVKGVNYSLGNFLFGKNITLTDEDISKMKIDKKNDLYSVVFYLAPGDYHRYHSHDQISVEKINHIPGYLYNVKDTKLTPETYIENERIIMMGNSDFGKFYYGIVGATNVGSMDLSFDSQIKTNLLEHQDKVILYFLFN